MKSLAALLLVLALETSCTTLANRRDLYSPDPGPDYQSTTTKTTITTREEGPPAPLPPPAR